MFCPNCGGFMFDDNRPLTPETAEEVGRELDAQGFFERIMKKAFPNGAPSPIVSDVSDADSESKQTL